MTTKADMQASARIIGVSGTVQGKQFFVSSQGTIIGARETDDIRVGPQGGSAKYARISLREDGFYIVDLGSQPATKVNGSLISEARLSNGDEIQVGTEILEFRTEEASAPGSTEREGAPPPTVPAPATDRERFLFASLAVLGIASVLVGAVFATRGARSKTSPAESVDLYREAIEDALPPEHPENWRNQKHFCSDPIEGTPERLAEEGQLAYENGLQLLREWDKKPRNAYSAIMAFKRALAYARRSPDCPWRELAEARLIEAQGHLRARLREAPLELERAYRAGDLAALQRACEYSMDLTGDPREVSYRIAELTLKLNQRDRSKQERESRER